MALVSLNLTLAALDFVLTDCFAGAGFAGFPASSSSIERKREKIY
jgi:hypothetical protein